MEEVPKTLSAVFFSEPNLKRRLIEAYRNRNHKKKQHQRDK
jgi:hypothetical protein